jgi:hypothetical protein
MSQPFFGCLVKLGGRRRRSPASISTAMRDSVGGEEISDSKPFSSDTRT